MRTSFVNNLRCLVVLSLFAFVVALTPQLALAQGGGVDDPLGPFQLEGNVTSEGSICFLLNASGAFTATPSGTTCPSGFTLVTFATNDDWANVWAGTTHNALAISTIGPSTTPPEPFNSGQDDTFFAGGSKDTNGISSGPWLWKATTTPDKDDIEHAFAAAYTGTRGGSAGHTIIYFGMDRYSNSGDQAGGFWFFQDANVALANTSQGGGLQFTGHHTNNDLLIVSDFSTGGAISSIVAYKWMCSGTGAACDTNGSLQVASVSGYGGGATYIECNPTVGSSPLCAIVNGTGGLSVPFGFTGKSSASGFVSASTYAPGELLEGGIDLNQIFGANIPCFTRFMAETRSATSTTSSLQDLTAPVSFPLCKLGISKACNGPGQISQDGQSISYSFSATATNTGSGNLFNVTINDTLPDGTPATFTPSLPSTCTVPGGGTASCLKKGDSVTVNPIPFTATASNCHTGVTNCPSPLSATNTASAKSFTLPSGGTEVDSSDPSSNTATCTTPVTNTVTVKKACDAANGGATLVPSGNQVVVEVFYLAQVCNTGQSQLTNITLVDHFDNGTDNPSPNGITLAPGACTTTPVSGHYFPNAIDSTVGRFGFTDTISITSATATLGSNPTPPNPNPCALAGGTASDLACDTITCPICYDSVCTNQPQPSNF